MTALLLALACGAGLARAAEGGAELSPYGGFASIHGKKTGFFHSEKIGGRWMLVDPTGAGYLALGMTSLGYYPAKPEELAGPGRWGWDKADNPEVKAFRDLLRLHYPDRGTWLKAQLARVRSWGFNALADVPEYGPEENMPFCLLLGLSGGNNNSFFKDVYSKEFEDRVRTRVKERCLPRKDDPRLIGYFTDNELPWSMFWGGGMLDGYLSLAPGSPGKAEALGFVKESYKTVGEFNKAWGLNLPSLAALEAVTELAPGPGFDRRRLDEDRDRWLERAARRYFSFVKKEIRKQDSRHMILGTRFLTGDVSLALARAMKGQVDAVSANAYLVHNFPDAFFSAFCEAADAPLILSEFGYNAKDAGLPPDHPGAIPRVVESQADRAQKYEWYLSHLLSRPYLVGTFWWWYIDGFGGNPRGNFGVVSWKDKPYEVLVKAMAQSHKDIPGRLMKGPEPFQEKSPPSYKIHKMRMRDLDGDPVAYGGFDIFLDAKDGYEGWGFEQSGFRARGTFRHDGSSLILAVQVRDVSPRFPREAEVKAGNMNPWELDGIEFWMGHCMGRLYLDGRKAAYTIARGDPFPGVKVAGHRAGRGYFLELKVPLADLTADLKEGKIRLALGVNDGVNGERFRQLYWPASYEWQYQETFALGELTD